MTYPIPPSDFFWRYISGFLHINIFIFDTSALPLMITHPYPRAVVGILRDSSTILGYSDYNVLGLTRTRQDDISIDQQPPSPPSSPLPPGPVATFRTTKRPPQIRDGCEIDRVALETFFKEEWAKNSVNKAADPKAALEEKYVEAKKVTLPLKRLLRTDLPANDQDHIIKRLDDVQSELSDFMESVAMGSYKTTLWICRGNIQGSKELNLTDLFPPSFEIRDPYFKESPIVEAGVITPAWQQIVSEAMESKPRLKDPATLLSQDFLQYLGARMPNFSRARKIPKTTTHPLWDEALESIYAGKMVPQAGDDSRYTDSSSSSKPFKVTPSLSQGSCSGALSDASTAADADIESECQSEGLMKESLGTLTTTVMREYATNVRMIWSGDIYERLRRYVVRTVLRLNLRPQSEAKHRLQKQNRAMKKAEEVAAASMSASRKRQESQRNWKRWSQDLFNQLDHAIDTGRDMDRINKIFGLIDIHQERQPGVKEQNKSCGLNQSDDYETDSEFDDSDDEGDDGEAVDSGSGKRCDDVFGPRAPTAGQDCEMTEEQPDAGCTFNTETQGCDVYDSVARSPTGPPSPKEPTAKRLKGLEAISIKLLELPDSNEPITEETVRGKLFEPENYSSNEIEAVLRLVTLLRPYTPKKPPSGSQSKSYPKSVLTCGPFVYVANAVLRSAGYKDFTRRICPVPSVGSQHAVPLDSSGMFGIFGGQAPGRFDIKGPSGRLITSSTVARLSKEHRNFMFSGLFNMAIIDDACRKHGLEFAHRITYVDMYTVRITGRQAMTGPHRHISNSAYEDKKKKHTRPPGAINWMSELQESGHTSQSAAKASEETKIAQDHLVAELRSLKKDLQAATTVRRVEDRTLRHSEGLDREHKKELYRNLQEARTVVNDLKKSTIPLEAEMRQRKQQRYYYNKLSKTSAPPTQPSVDPSSVDPSSISAMAVTVSVPTIQHPGMQDFVETTSLKQLLEQVKDHDRQLPVPGTDRGLVTMSETVPSLWSTLGSLSNRYYVLHGLPDTHHTDYGGEVLEQPTSQVITEATDTEVTIVQPFQHSGLGVCSTSAGSLDQACLSERTLSGSSPQEATMEVVRFAKSNRITAKRVKEVGGVGKATRAREHLLRRPENQMIPELHNEVGKNSVLKAQTVREVDSAQATRQSAAQPLRDFEACKKLKKGSHHKDIQLQRAWQTIAADERRRIQDFARGAVEPQQASVNDVNQPGLIHFDDSSHTGPPPLLDYSSPSLLVGAGTIDTPMAEPQGHESDPSTGPESLAVMSPLSTESPLNRNTVDPIDGFCSCGRHHLPIRAGGVLAYPQVCPRDTLPVIPIMFVGTAGIGTGSRLGGHLKYGGKKVIEKHALSVPVLMTDENMTSKVCPLCFAILRLVKELRLVNGIEKLVTINGAVQCDNPDCESVRTGYARRGRDSNACVNIALAGFTTVLSDDRQPLPPYRRSTRPKGATPSESQSLATGTTQTSSTSTMEPLATVASDAADELV
ncbi:MAG: hypothetical protein J3R72DRAFT_505748 [Linnemannia gamsii]|nr:MAG: hypothetical protein J3R72DRAFT_505748 [Linnemannia gamsii]